jgi:DNA invertase Pin-like site-specific DNA recombinase
MGKTGQDKQDERYEMSAHTAVIYTRVSSREQEQEGFSLDAQSKLLREYAVRNGLEIAHAFEDVETAKATGRKQFGEMVTYLRRNHRSCRILLVEKTDRLYRNYRDAVTLEDLDIEIHFIKESQVLSKDAKSQIKFMHDIRLAVARNYSENLREEVKKGMQEKASQGIYPGRAPFGYRNNGGTRSIEIHPEKGAIAQRVFELYMSGRYSLLTLSKAIRGETGASISKTNLHKMLTNPFYIGQFEWGGHTYGGTHTPLITPQLFSDVQAVIRGYNKPKYGKHDFAFRGLLKCAHDACTVTGEIKKGKYVYYHCSGGRGPCDLPRFREQDLAQMLGNVVRDITIPHEVAERIAQAVEREQKDAGARVAHERVRLDRELSTVRARMDAAYCDKLDGKIPEGFWQRRQAEWQAHELRITSQLEELKEPNKQNTLVDVRRIL